MANEAFTAEWAVIISYPTNASGISVLFKTAPKYINYITKVHKNEIAQKNSRERSPFLKSMI